MIDRASKGWLAANYGGAVAVLQQDGSVKTWGPSATNAPVTTLAGLPGIKAIYPAPNGGSQNFIYLLETGSAFYVFPSGAVAPINTYFPPGRLAPSNDALTNPLALVVTSDGNALYVNSTHELVCADAKSPSAVPAIINAPYYLAGVQHAAANDDVCIVVRDDGTLTGWGSNLNGLLTFPAGLSGVTKVAVGRAHAVALKTDGTLVAWGDNSLGQCSVPAGLTGVTQISAYALGDFTLALKSDNTLAAFGDNSSSQCSGASGLTGISKVSAGKRHAVALDGSSTIHAWGDNSQGQCTISGTGLDVAAGDDDTVVANGRLDYYGAVAKAPPSSFASPSGTDPLVNVHYTKVDRLGQQIVCRGGYINGTYVDTPRIWSWPAAGLFGRPAAGVVDLSVSDEADISSVCLATPDPDSGLGQLPYSLGSWTNGNEAYNTVAVTSAHVETNNTGVLQAYVSTAGAIGFWGTTDRLNSVVVTAFPGNSGKVWKQLALGDYAAAALDDAGHVSAWGDNTHGATDVPVGLSGVTDLAVMRNSTGTTSTDTFFALKADGTVACWGYEAGALAALSAQADVVAFAVGALSVFLLHKDRSVTALTAVGTPYPAPYTLSATAWQDVAVTAATICGATPQGDLLNVGNALLGFKTFPADVQKLRSFGTTHFSAENGDGTLAEWSTYDGAERYASDAFWSADKPTHVSDIVSYDGNDSVTLAVIAQAGFGQGGAVVAWGPGAEFVDIPTSIIPGAAGLSTNPVVEVACGNDHYMARFANGHILVWGDNTNGEVSNAPAANGFVQIAAGNRSCLALDSTGTVTAWGSDTSANGETGVTAITSHSLFSGGVLLKAGNALVRGLFSYNANPPQTPPAWTDAVELHLGYCSILALNASGTVYQWHHTSAGGFQHAPVALPADLGAAVSICPMQFGGLAIQTDGTVRAWGTDPRWPVAPNLPTAVRGGATWTFLYNGSQVPISSVWYVNANASLGCIGNSSLVPPPFGLGAVLNFDYIDAAYASFAAAVCSDGSLKMWGAPPAWTPAKALNAVRVGATTLGPNRVVMGLYQDGSVDLFVEGGYPALETIPAGLAGVTQIALATGSVNFAVALNGDGTVAVWGDAGLDVLAVPAGLAGVSKLAVGSAHIVALKTDHSVAAWGTDTDGSVTSVNGATNVADIAAGAGTTLVYLDGSIGVYPPPTGAVSNPMTITGSLPASGTMGAPYSASLTITGAFIPPAAVDTAASSIPAWMGVTIDGADVSVSGTPSAGEDSTVSIVLEDASASSQHAALQQRVQIFDPNEISFVTGMATWRQPDSNAYIATAAQPAGAGLQVGDTAVCCVSIDKAGATTSAVNGATALFENVALNGNGQVVSCYAVQIASLSDDIGCQINNALDAKVSLNIGFFRNADTVLDVSSQNISASAGASPISMTANGITTLTDKDAVLFIGVPDSNAGGSASTSISAPAGYTLVSRYDTSIASASSHGEQVMAYQLEPTAGAVASAAGSFDNSGSTAAFGAWLLGLKYKQYVPPQQPMTFNSPSIPTIPDYAGAAIGSPISYHVELTGSPVEPVTFSFQPNPNGYKPGNPPSWVTHSYDTSTYGYPAMVVSGEETALDFSGGTFDYEITATDSSNPPRTDSMYLEVYTWEQLPDSAYPAAVNASFTLPAGMVAPVTVQATEPYSGNAMPAWMSFSSDGTTVTCSGTPPATDAAAYDSVNGQYYYYFRLTMTDSTSGTPKVCETDVSLTITGVPAQ